MNKTVLCPECMQLTEYHTEQLADTFTIRGEEVTVQTTVAVCGACGQEIGVPELDDDVFHAAFAVYRVRHCLLQPEQIKALRSKYGIGQKAFAKLLGWGEVTLARYEGGALQSESHDAALRLAEDPANVRRLLAQNRDRLSKTQVEVLERRLDQLSGEHEGVLAREEAAQYCAGPQVRKLREMAVFFAGFENTWRTKLNKLLFYSDFLHYKRFGCAISSARYVHMQYGPVPADFYTLQAALVDDASLDERQGKSGDCSGTVFVALRPADRSVFSAAELQTMDDVARTFESWSARRVMEYSHQELGWQHTTDRETIDYRFAENLRLS